jgi:peroxiredoxin
MRKLMLSSILLVFTLFAAKAQLPENAEDISPLLISETLPGAVLVAPDGSQINLMEVIKQKPSVLIFYRGGWCPFCNAHLAEIAEVQNDVVNLGYQIIAISPDSPGNLQTTEEKQSPAYNLYSDSDGALIKSVGIAFKAPDRSIDRLLEWSGGHNVGFLPVPSVFVTDTSGKIVFEYINPDYRTRLSAGLLMAVLRELKNEQK